MKILDAIPLLLQLAVEYFKLRNKSFVFDILEKFDNRIDKLTEQRNKLRQIPAPEAQKKADHFNDEIIEEQQKMHLFLQDLNKWKKPSYHYWFVDAAKLNPFQTLNWNSSLQSFSFRQIQAWQQLKEFIELVPWLKSGTLIRNTLLFKMRFLNLDHSAKELNERHTRKPTLRLG